MPLLRSFILNADGEPFVEESQFPEPLGEQFKTEGGRFKNFTIGFKPDLGSRILRFSNDFKLRLYLSPFIQLVVDFTIPSDFQFHKFRKGINDGEADSVKSSGNLVGLIVKLTSGMEFGHHHFDRRSILFLMKIDRNAPSIITDGHAVVDMDDDLDLLAIPRQSLIDAVIDQFMNQVMKAFRPGISNIHGGPFPDSGKTIQDLDLFCRIFFFCFFHPISFLFLLSSWQEENK